ncbi:MAG: ExbD/TolR family protein [Alphaproteobacteria bacterium]|jgi:biopolymer transport protein TolR|nr:ExbD/TolR family protein [Alphaproteobacteria bacterium]PHY00173.1 MAG: protein TolR [Rhodospirillaceae bacterium]
MGAFIKSAGGGSKSSRRAFAPIAEINVTPMVDVMLVLLVIFIITAPLLTTGVNVNLPQTSRAKSLTQDNKPLNLFVQKDGTFYLNGPETMVVLEDLRAKLAAMKKSNPDLNIYVRGDKDVPYGTMMTAMAEVQAAGFTKVAFVTEAPKKSMRSPR